MSIPEEQLAAWSNCGATTTLKNTHEVVRRALARCNLPAGATSVDYLQGSYANDTHVRGTSDVDIVLELTSCFRSNLTSEQKKALGLADTSYGDLQFRTDVLSALTAEFGVASVDASGANAIKLRAEAGRQNADILPCVSYRYYDDLRISAYGVAYISQSTRNEIVNYPKQHIENGQTKNGVGRTRGYYKPSVRMFKNARTAAVGDDPALRKQFRSYFVECLLYNVPDSKFSTSCRDTFCACVNFLDSAIRDGTAAKFVTQSGRRYLFEGPPTGWTQDAARDLLRRLTLLWNEWK